MADTLYFSRDTKVFVAPLDPADGSEQAVFELPVLDGFSFSQATNASEITLNEMADSAGNSRRARQMFTDSYAPAEWSFSTYARPFKSAGSGTGAADTAANHHAVEEVLWALMVGDGDYASSAFTGITPSLTNSVINFDSSNKVTLGTCNIYFVMGGASSGTKTVYKIAGAVVNEASVDFDIDGIATINWSGFGKIITEATEPTVTVTEAVTSTANFIRNRLTSLSVTAADTTNFPGAGSGVYNLVLTGGNVTISNNLTFLTPETLGVVNQPLGHITGTRAVSGSFTCYLNAETGSSADLFESLIEATDVITNSFNLTFKVGGAAGTPRMELAMAKCHLEVPTHGIEDVISLETTFHALPSSISETDELTITYVGQ
jgi:hypothetical protein